MPLPDNIRIKDRSLEVYLGGPGFGEGVFLLIGKTVGIGLDCCSSFFQSRKGTESFIESKVKELPDEGALIWILTHFHYDHYHGLASLLTRLDDRIKEMVLPLDYTPGDLSYLQEQLRELDSEVNVRLAHKDFEKLRKLITLPPFNHSVSRVQGVQPLSIGLTLGSDEIPLRVKICSSSTDVFDNALAESLKEVKTDESVRSRKYANRGSYIVHCRVGNFEGLFLGDAGTERIDQMVKTGLLGKSTVDCLKVGHHGSLDATNEELLKLCAGQTPLPKKQYALIAPYSAARLPNQDTIDLLQKFGYEVHLTKLKKDQAMTERVVAEGVLAGTTVTDAIRASSDIVNLNFRF